MRVGVLRLGGAVLALAGALGFVAGAVHPQGGVSHDYHNVIVTMLASAQWPLAHWVALVYSLAAAWALWLLIDGGWMQESALAQAGARLATLASLFMAVEFAVELSSRVEAGAYAAGQPTSLISLVEPMQAVGWPALGLGYLLLALGSPVSAPVVVRGAGALGAAALAIGGVVVEGFRLAAFGPLFAIGGLAFIWLIWAGAKLLFGRTAVRNEGRRELSPA